MLSLSCFFPPSLGKDRRQSHLEEIRKIFFGSGFKIPASFVVFSPSHHTLLAMLVDARSLKPLFQLFSISSRKELEWLEHQKPISVLVSRYGCPRLALVLRTSGDFWQFLVFLRALFGISFCFSALLKQIQVG